MRGLTILLALAVSLLATVTWAQCRSCPVPTLAPAPVAVYEAAPVMEIPVEVWVEPAPIVTHSMPVMRVHRAPVYHWRRAGLLGRRWVLRRW